MDLRQRDRIGFRTTAEARNRRRLEQKLREQLKHDRSKTWISRLSRFGIIEMTRQRLRPSKDKVGRESCPTCGGRGTVRSVRSVATAIFRQLKRDFRRKRAREAVVWVPSRILKFLVNEEREALLELEEVLDRRIQVQLDESRKCDQFGIEYR